jgi:glycosyltransferase involved in cell wall biosynthesis
VFILLAWSEPLVKTSLVMVGYVMVGLRRNKATNSQVISVLWMSFTILDTDLHKGALLDIVQNFAGLGHKSSLIALRSRNTFQLKDSQVRIIAVPLRYVPLLSSLMYAITTFFFLPLFIVISKPNFVIINPDIHIVSSLPGLVVSKFTKTKFVLDIRSPPVETVGASGFLQNFWFSVSLLITKKLFAGLTIITHLMKNEICNTFDINPDTVGVWTTGVSDTLFNPESNASKGMALKEKLGLSKKFVVFYHGVFTTTRKMIETANAIKILKNKHPDVVFFLLGSGPIVPSLNDLIQKEGLQDNVIIHTPVEQSEVPEFISMSDVCIIPLPYHQYWRFQCPLKLLEYLAMEKVVIATDIPAHRSVMGNEKCAIYIPSVEPMEIAKAIEYAYHNKETLDEWGKTGQKIIKDKYTWEKVAKDLEKYLLSIDNKSAK